MGPRILYVKINTELVTAQKLDLSLALVTLFIAQSSDLSPFLVVYVLSIAQ